MGIFFLKYATIFILATTFFNTLYCQSSFSIDMDNEMREIFTMYEIDQKNKPITTYSVQLYFGSSKRKAEVTSANYEISQNQKAKILWDSPYFIVVAGLFFKEQDALISLKEVKKNFPNAKIRKGTTSLQEKIAQYNTHE